MPNKDDAPKDKPKKYSTIGSGKGWKGFKKGVSANPSGRPKGIIDKRLFYAKLLESHKVELVNKAIQMALKGDSRIICFLLDKVLPAKPKDNPIILEDFEGTLAEKSEKVTLAIAGGEISPIEGFTIMSSLTAQANIQKVDEIERRFSILETALASSGNNTNNILITRDMADSLKSTQVRMLEAKVDSLKIDKENENEND